MISISTTPGVSVAVGITVGSWVGASVAAPVGSLVGVPVATARRVGAEAGMRVSCPWDANALTSIGVGCGLGISAGAQSLSCPGAARPTLFTIEASAGLVTANKAIKPMNTIVPMPINKTGNSQFVP